MGYHPSMQVEKQKRRILRAVIYARVSKDDSGRGRSPAEQVDACESDCAYEGWTVAAVLMDSDRGASRHSKGQRVDFDRLPDVLRQGDVLVVWEPSRITRDMAEFGPFCDLLAARGVLLYYDGKTHDMDDDDDRYRVWQDILDGAKAAGKTRKRVIRAMDANVRQGRPHGPTPPGYKIVRDIRTGESLRRDIDRVQQVILQGMADRVLAHESLASIARGLSDEWVASGGKPLRAADIRRFLITPTTYGMRVHKGEIAGRGMWEPCLDLDLLPQLRSILLDPLRLSRPERGSAPRHLLSFGRCGVCGGPIGYRAANAQHRKTDRYTCRQGCVTRNAERAEAFVEEFFLRLMCRPETAAALSIPDGGTSVAAELEQIESLKVDLLQLVRDAARTRMSAAAVGVYVEEVEEQIAAADARVRALSVPVDPALRALADPDSQRVEWRRFSVVERRRILRAVLDIRFMPIGKIGRREGVVGVEIYPIGILSSVS